MPWLMKSEPEAREDGGNKFSVDDFEAAKTTPWDGVRNPEASKLMREKMKVGDKVLFYHSNCKTPGVAALAEVSKEGYPDHTAWDPSSCSFDKNAKESSPKWFMVDVTIKKRVDKFVSLSFLKHVAQQEDDAPSYLTSDHVGAIRSMALFTRPRLSVQPVSELAYDAIVLLAERGGWDEPEKKKKSGSSTKRKRSDDEDGPSSRSTRLRSGRQK